MKRSPRLRYFLKFQPNGDVIPGSGVLRTHKPKSPGVWQEITANICCQESSDCNGMAMFLFSNLSTTQTITGISFNDYTPTISAIGLNGFYMVSLPAAAVGSLAVTINNASSSSDTLNAYRLFGTGTITPVQQQGNSTTTYTLAISAQPCDQFIIQLQNSTTTSTTTTSA